MNPIFVRAVSVGRRVVKQAVKRLSSRSWNGKKKSTPRSSSQMPPKSSYRLRSGPGTLDDGWRGYNGLVDMGYKKHFRVHHGENEFASGNCHIDGIESF